MLNLRLARPMLIALAACAANCFVQGSALADDAQENKALKEQMRQMMQRMDALQKQVEALQNKQAAPPPVVTAPPAAPPATTTGPAVAKQAPPEPAFEKFAKGFYGTLDVSADYATKGMSDLGAFHYEGYPPAVPGVFAQGGAKVGPVGRVGWQADLSTNKSVLGYRGSHTIPGGAFDFIYQIEVQPSITSAPGASTGYTAQSNVTKAGIGYGNSFVGVSNEAWGKFKAGTTYTPYKQSTDRMNPFSGMLGDYAVVMGNTGGDNRVEFGTRLDHSIWYESPKFAGFTANVLYSPGQNRSSSSDNIAAGDSDCTGGNIPGSGGTGGAGIGPVRCNDGSFSDAISADVVYSEGPLYAVAAYERHMKVNRSSDILGSPLAALDTADEDAWKVGVQYVFPTRTTVSAIFEDMHRYVPSS